MQQVGDRAAPDLGERAERALHIESVLEQRLAALERRRRHHADRPALPAIVEQHHRAGLFLTFDFDAGQVVAQLDRQLEVHGRLAGSGLERERLARQQPAVGGERAHDREPGLVDRDALGDDVDLAGAVFRRQQQDGQVLRGRRDDAQRAQLLQRLGKSGHSRIVEPVGVVDCLAGAGQR
ncbi:MAG: hypothetical protein WDO24_00935 [Pseudomonadota bacterium]